jgi:uncharacterized Tic20 family protein
MGAQKGSEGVDRAMHLTQKEWVLAKLQLGEKMSTVLAWNYGIKQLPYVIWKLKQEGYRIVSEQRKDMLLNRNYTVYSLQ